MRSVIVSVSGVFQASVIPGSLGPPIYWEPVTLLEPVGSGITLGVLCPVDMGLFDLFSVSERRNWALEPVDGLILDSKTSPIPPSCQSSD